MALFFLQGWKAADMPKTTLIKRRAILFLSFSLLFSLQAFSSCIVSCRTSLNLSISPNGYSVLTPGILLVDAGCDPADFTVQIIDNFGMNLGDTIFCSQVGETLDAHVIETATGNSCNTSITIYDNLKPQITCQDTTMYCGQDYSPEVIGYPGIFDNCTNLDSTDLSYVDIPNNFSCFHIENGDTLNAIIERRWTANDENGNQGICIQTIRLKKSFLSDVQLPPSLDGNLLPPIDCQADPTDLSITGFPNIDGLALNASNFCDLAADYTDQQINICGAGYLILRTWTLADWCTGDIDTYTQFIKVADTEAPVLNCPQDLTVSTLVEDCAAVVTLPMTTATDNCSSVTINPTWAFGVGFGPFENIPLGQYPVTYTATDACGNATTCEIILTVADMVPPTNICTQFTQVNLNLNGEAYAPALSFDAGSYDNCSLKELKVAKIGGSFEDGVTFDCTDIANNPVLVTLRAIDYFNNYNECDIYVTVLDLLPPQITCPDAITLSCTQDYMDLGITGAPVIIDNCSLDTTYFTDENNLNICNVGTIERTWITRDAGGTETQCTQIITLIDTTELSISFPSDYTTSICNPDLSPTITGSPIITNEDCESIFVKFTDDTLSQAFPACFVIYRHWEIYEWCTHDAQTNEGYWEASQTLIVEDNIDPVIAVPNDTIVYSLAADCGLTYIGLQIPTAADCSNQVTIINNSPFAINNGADASGNYPPGTHTINFQAADNCGNTATGQMTVTVLDGKEPTAVCKSGLIFNLDQFGNVTVDADDINEGSFDNCTAAAQLIFSLSPNTFSCGELGNQLVTLTVIDEAGNAASCQTSITIQDNMGSCPSGTISGNIEFWSGAQGVNATELELSGGPGGMQLSSIEGDYQFNELPLGQNYLVEAFKDGHDANGISILDIVILSRSIIGLAPLTNPYQILAGDIDRDNSLTVFDMVQMQKIILLVDSVNVNSNSWRFVPEDYVFPNPLNPFQEAIPEYQAINNLQSGETIAGFIGIKLGDVSGNTDLSLAFTGGGGVEEKRLVDGEKFGNSAGYNFYPKRNTEAFGYQTVFQLTPGLESVKVLFDKDSFGTGDYFYQEETGELRVLNYSPLLSELNPGTSIFEIIIEGKKVEAADVWLMESKMVDKNGQIQPFEFDLSSH